MTTIVIAEDQALIRAALRAMLELEDDLTVIGEAGTCAEAVAVVGANRPNVLLLDVQMPDGGLGVEDGLEAIAPATAASPDTRVIVVTTFGRPGYLRRALEAGAVGFLVKDTPADRLIEAIRRAARGLRVVDPELAAASLSIGPSPLSAKEALVLGASAGGASTEEIAAAVSLSEGTVRNYLSSAIGKLGARNRAEALLHRDQQRLGLIPLLKRFRSHDNGHPPRMRGQARADLSTGAHRTLSQHASGGHDRVHGQEGLRDMEPRSSRRRHASRTDRGRGQPWDDRQPRRQRRMAATVPRRARSVAGTADG